MNDELQYDTPISDPGLDLLGRKNFSSLVAKSIIKLEASQGFVFGLYGPWGSGKSTVINFIEHYIKAHNSSDSSQTKVLIFRFNPWMFSGSENLIKSYLDQLRIRLNMKDSSADLQSISKMLALLENSTRFLETMPGMSEAKWIKEVFSFLRSKCSSKSEDLKKDLHHIRKDITEALKNQPDKILVIIDDLDRLFEDEIKEFIKMIKAVCDFPKIIYLIACDSEKVANALHSQKNNDGYDYLEKIVQCQFNIPRPNQHVLNQFFTNNLNQILGEPQSNDPLFDKIDWGNIFHDGVSPCLATPRNVKTLLNSISACYPAVRGEVNVADFIGIQTLRIFYPNAYNLIEGKKELLTGSTNEIDRSDVEKTAHDSFYEHLHQQVPSKNLEHFKGLMSRLFPKYAHIVSKGVIGYGADYCVKWKQQRRACSEDCFDLYFKLSISDDSFSLAEMESILSLIDNQPEFKEKLLSLIKKEPERIDRYKIFLADLESFTENKIPQDKIKPLLQAIYDISDKIGSDDEYRGFFDITISMSMLRISYQLIKRLENEEDRYNLLSSIFENSESISMVVDEAVLIDSNEQKNQENMINSEHAKKLISIAYWKIKEFAQAGKLSKVPRFANCIYRWHEWAEKDDEVKKYISGLVETNAGLVDFLTGFLSTTRSLSEGDRVVRIRYRVRHEDILKFIGPEELEKLIIRTRSILSDDIPLEGLQKKALETFIEEIDRPNRF